MLPTGCGYWKELTEQPRRMMPNSETFSYFASVLVIVYFSGALLIAKRLERSYPVVWDRIGRPSLLNWGIANSSRLGHAMFFGTSLGQLNDRGISTLIWIERVIATLIIVAVIVWISHYHGSRPPP